MARKEEGSKTAKVLYRPVGIASSVISGVIATQLFKQVWKRVSPRHDAEAPKPLESDYRVREIVIAAAAQGAIFATVKALVDRGGARLFQRWSGEWPGK